ncbi:Endonuclease/exonuclease/phosphatase [Glomus cerebriforme]|uniref:Endonuclease/exonuclease/phosphatase n=1 Tax=Glomus cerebriforme TaxID=658196 RepID=A0A397T877_9GLOM|nr:Endonuclease/exonuclease/phosphatase [Glomus cerebriforme]
MEDRSENKVIENKKQDQEPNKEHSPDVLPKKRTRVNKRERKEIKKQQNIKEGKIDQNKPPKPQEIQYDPILKEMITLPNIKEETNGITIMTYNLLAQSLCKRELFPNCGNALKWKNRRPRLIKEIFHHSPDIGCFQEMDDINYNDTFKPKFDESGYDTLFFKGDKRHGCCIAWKKSKFIKIKELTLDFDKFGVPTMKTNCIGIIIALNILNDGKENKGIVIGTTHLYWRPQSMYERTRQCLILYQNLLKLKKEFKFPAFLAGDFNSTPKDPIYHLMVNKSSLNEQQISILQNSMRSFEKESNGGNDTISEKEEILSSMITPKDNDDEITIEQSSSKSFNVIVKPQSSQNLSSPLLKPQLESLSDLLSNFENLPKCLSLYGQNYHLIDSENIEHSEPKITNYGIYFKGTLDYIFFVLDQNDDHVQIGKDDDQSKIKKNYNIKVTKLLKLPREEEFGSSSLPNYKFNSDHVCLMVEVVGIE